MKIKTYVINLRSDYERKEYITKILEKIDILDVEFVDAVDGRTMSAEERYLKFDEEKAYKRYGRYCSPGAIGCTLSHRKCYELLLRSEYDYALILEDDISILDDLNNLSELFRESVIGSEESLIILLSGGFWYRNVIKRINNKYRMANIQDAWFTHSYFINKEAVNKILERGKNEPFVLADDWLFVKKLGVSVYGILPHLINQSSNSVFISTINNDSDRSMIKSNLKFYRKLETYYYGGIKKMLRLIGRYENEE